MTGSGGKKLKTIRDDGTKSVTRIMAVFFFINVTITGKIKLDERLPMAITDKSPPAARKLIPASFIMDGSIAPITKTAIPLTAYP
jgi:hypothetical protein